MAQKTYAKIHNRINIAFFITQKQNTHVPSPEMTSYPH